MSKDLVQQAVDGILDRIADERFVPGRALPGEAELAVELAVSRLTMREAVKVLRDRGVLDVVHGRGTYVRPRHEWKELGTLISITKRNSSLREVGLRLVELRRMIEVGAAGLAAHNRTEEDLVAIESHLGAMEAAGRESDVETTVQEDLAFHRAIMQASANPFILAVMASLEPTLREVRLITSALPDVRTRALGHHVQILDAIRAGDEEAAKDAMRSHMTQTRMDFSSAVSEENPA
ncbi:MAG: FadR/GntR family transcriptional regulator [Actinomycetaceae bacterium]|nr:FadR/GntR family transcriptional regulator [Actinomycetaceae bacterium]